MKYSAYNTIDFLEDSLFLKWVRDHDPEARDFWEKWLRNHPHKKAVLMEAKHIAQHIQPSSIYKLNEKEYVDILENVLKESIGGPEYPIEETKKNGNFFWKIAAVLIPLFIAGGFYIYSLEHSDKINPPKTSAIVEKIYPKGKKATLTLKDKTRVNINAGSKIEFPENFNENPTREVYLEGEAFFDVAKNPAKPFIITTAEIKTRVLGTSFNIKANPSDKIIDITVVTGKVSVYDEQGNHIILKPFEKVSYNKVTKEIEKRTCDNLERIIGWKEGWLIFEKATFSEIFLVLENWYGVEIKSEKGWKNDGIYSGKFKNETLEKVLEGIAYTSNFDFEVKENIVYIK
ncbi:FecR family protein [Flexithrix dorotheae]|uniref:FecR family protein n=1 Tax=Flexithrix dorotheae TaxID=70993 RepID=UPI000382BD7F|nr:FecR family protein [Flexithrix dorotheae]